jgi:hypothetical protein
MRVGRGDSMRAEHPDPAQELASSAHLSSDE